jgi:hypothetical protein
LPASLMAAIMAQETGRGTSSMLQNYNNPAGLLRREGRRYVPRQYSSIEAGIDAAARTLNNLWNQLPEANRTVQGLRNLYAPDDPRSDPRNLNKDWVPGVDRFLRELNPFTQGDLNAIPFPRTLDIMQGDYQTWQNLSPVTLGSLAQTAPIPITQQQAGWLEGDPRRNWNPDAGTWEIINDPDKWNPLTQEEAGRYSGSPELTYRGGEGREGGWGYYGTSPIAPFYRLTEEQAGWARASPTMDQPTWNPEQNSWGYWGEPPIDLFPTGRMDYMQQLRDFGMRLPGQMQLWDITPESGSGQQGGRSWFDLFNPVGTAHAGLEPLPNFLQGWDPEIGRGGQGALNIFRPSQILQQWDPNIASGYPGGVSLWDAGNPRMSATSALTLPDQYAAGVDPGNLGMWDFNAANPLNPFSSQYIGGGGGAYTSSSIDNPFPTPPGGYGSMAPSPAAVQSAQYQAQIAAQQAAFNAAQVAAFNQQQEAINMQNLNRATQGPWAGWDMNFVNLY